MLRQEEKVQKNFMFHLIQFMQKFFKNNNKYYKMKLIKQKPWHQTPSIIFWMALILLFMMAQSQTLSQKKGIFREQVDTLKKTSSNMTQEEIRQRIQKLSAKNSGLKHLRAATNKNPNLIINQPENIDQQQELRIPTTKTNIASTSNQAMQKAVQHRLLTSGLPSSFDWSTKLQLSAVKSIGYCAASWSFAAAAFFEADSIINLNASASIDLSEQYLISCDQISQGCRSGFLQTPIDLVTTKGGLPLQSNYPYSPNDLQPKTICKSKSLFFHVTNSYRMSYYNLFDQEKIKSIILKKPAVIAMCGQDLIGYTPGQTEESKILKCRPSNRVLDHAALLVGYTEKYWIVKNQWGTRWGLNGYAYISRNEIQDCCIGSAIHTTGLQSTNCQIANCLTCIQSHSCFKCQPGHYVYHQPFTGVQSCNPCSIANCSQCFDYYGYCNYCIDGYAINDTSGKCEPSTIDGCNHVVNGYCVQCHKGFVLASNMHQCVPDCMVKNCYLCAEGPCTQCKPGYTLGQVNNTQTCTKNPCSVANCSACDTSGTCVACNKYFTLSGTSCINTCNITDCLGCGPQNWYCLQCIPGKSYNYWTQVCQLFNVTNCAIQLFGKCYQCVDGYDFDKTHTACVQVCYTENCVSCVVGDASVCLGCKTGYSLMTNTTTGETTCIAYTCNITNCTACDINGTTCLACITQFHVYNATSHACQIQCKLSNCLICLPTDTICSKCKSGYAVQYSSSSCTAMNYSHCSLVGYDSGKFECWQCEGKYRIDFMTWDKCYLNCRDYYCTECDEATLSICSKCIDGYNQYLVNSQLMCMKIPPLIPRCQLVTLNQSYCYQCEDYYYFDAELMSCRPYTSCTDPNCVYCPAPGSTATGCQCISGLAYDTMMNTCTITPFDDNCLKIQQYGTQLICVECANGLVLSNDYLSCVQACLTPNCAQCYDYYNNYCRVCNDGFYPNEAWACNVCPIDNCKTCTPSTCMECLVGYYLVPDGSACLPYVCTGQFIFNGFSCACPIGTYFTNNTCMLCSDNCARCDIDGCVECKTGFYMQNQSCISCIANCDVCNSTAGCMRCRDKFFFEQTSGKCIQIGFNRTYFISSGQSVVQCPAGCIECTENATCHLCAQGYALSSVNNQCLPCEGNCKTCYSHILFACLSCNPGYYYNGLKCLPCINSFCIECNTAPYVCTKCAIGYSLKQKGCVKCPQDCLQCNYRGQCTRCVTGFTITDSKTCEQCFGSCIACNPTYLNQCVDVCATGQYMENGTCKSCDGKCHHCVNSTVCLMCKPGYILSGDSCINPCREGCYQCNSTNYQLCLQCFAGYSLSADGTCTANTTCANSSCIACPNQYVWQLGNCIPCATNPNCSQCSQLDTTRCIECIDTFYLSNKTCYKCPNQCLKCTRQNVCMECMDGYFLMGIESDTIGRCMACNLDCKTCAISADNCLSCVDDTFELTVAHKCLKKDRILIITKLDIAYDLYSTIARNVRQDFASLLGADYINQTMYVLLKSIKRGSTILEVLLSVPANQDPTVILNQVKQQLSSSNTIGGVSIIEVSQVVIYDPNGNYDNQQQPQQLPTNIDDSSKKRVLTIVLAVVIPSVVVIALIIIGCIIKKRKNGEGSNSVVNEDSFSADAASQSSKKTNPKKLPVSFNKQQASNASDAYIYQHTQLQTNENLVTSQQKVLSENLNEFFDPKINPTEQNQNDAIKQADEKKAKQIEYEQIKIQKKVVISSDQEGEKRDESGQGEMEKNSDEFEIQNVEQVDTHGDLLGSLSKMDGNNLLANQEVLEIDEDD